MEEEVPEPATKRPRTNGEVSLEETRTETCLPFPVTHIAAPMVGASDLPFRLLCRQHGTNLCYTEMLFSDMFVDDEAYRTQMLQTCAEDKPLVVQFCGNNAQVMAKAAKLAAAAGCDACDINLGCPLIHAQKNLFGAYLLDREHWDTVTQMVQAMVEAADIPIFCKIRLLPKLEDTIEFAKRLEAAGCSLLAVHGRQRGKPGDKHKYPADLESIRSVVNALTIPVVSNGNVSVPDDVIQNLKLTSASGIMCGEGLLRNPQLFSPTCEDATMEPTAPALRKLAQEYLQLVRKYPPKDMRCVRSHMMWMCGKEGRGTNMTFKYVGPFNHEQLRLILIDASDVNDFETIVNAVFQ